MIFPHAGIRWFLRGFLLSVVWAACAGSLLAEGKAARFQGVERWQATGSSEVTVQIQGQTKQRKSTNKFKLEHHKIQGTKEIWEGILKVKGTDKDSNMLMWGSVSSEATWEYRLELDANSDEAVLYMHVISMKSKGQMGMLGLSANEFSLDRPDQDMELRAAIIDNSDSLVFHQESHIDLMVGSIDSISVLTLEPDEVPLKAVLVVGSAIRGTKARLDGSKSRGHIKTFTWTLTPDADSGGKTVTFDTSEPSADLVLLANVSVSLTVSDGRKTSPPASGEAKPVPRKWETKTDRATTPVGSWNDAGRLTPGGKMLGQNQDRERGSPLPWLQPNASPKSWEGKGFKISPTPVNDPGRPFDGFHLVSEYNLHIRRQMVIQPDLLGTVYRGVNLSVKNHATKEHGEDFDLLLDQVRTHEQLHTDIVLEHLPAVDPVKDVEALIYRDPDGLIDRVNGKIGVAEELLQGGDDPAFHREITRRMSTQREYKRFQRSGEVLIHDGSGGTTPWKISSYALLLD